MFDTLTPAERLALRGKLSDWSHRFAETGHTLAEVAHRSNPPGTDSTILWQQATRFYDAMTELHALRADLLAA